MNSLADWTGSGWKGYVGGLGLVAFGLALGADAIIPDLLPQLEGTFDAAVQAVLVGLAAFGIRHKQSRNG